MHLPHPVTGASALPRTHHGHSFLRLTRPQLAFGAIAFSAMMATIPALPASAEIAQESVEEVEAAPAFVAPKTAAAALPEIERPTYSISVFSVVQMPVPPGTGILANFGARSAPCAGCSSFHSGADFQIAAGMPVLAIADGVVTEVGPDSSLGVFVKIEHVIDGQTVTSTYAHMGVGSMPFSVGDNVARGTQVGIVGMTGIATAPHLHFEIRLGGNFGTAINPLPWLAAHVNV